MNATDPLSQIPDHTIGYTKQQMLLIISRHDNIIGGSTMARLIMMCHVTTFQTINNINILSLLSYRPMYSATETLQCCPQDRLNQL